GGGSAVPAALGTVVVQRGREAICRFASLGLIANLHGASGRSERHTRTERRESRTIRCATWLQETGRGGNCGERQHDNGGSHHGTHRWEHGFVLLGVSR